MKTTHDWKSVSEADWQRGFAHVAGLMGVSKTAAHSAKKRLDRNAPGRGRTRKPIPEDYDPGMTLDNVMAKYSITRPTAMAWKRRTVSPEPE